MSKNWRHGDIGAGVTLALTVPAKARAGDIAQLGSDGLLGYLITPRHDGDAVQYGDLTVKENQAVVRPLTHGFTVELDVTLDEDELTDRGKLVWADIGTNAIEYTTAAPANDATTAYVIGWYYGHGVVITGPSARTTVADG